MHGGLLQGCWQGLGGRLGVSPVYGMKRWESSRTDTYSQIKYYGEIKRDGGLSFPGLGVMVPTGREHPQLSMSTEVLGMKVRAKNTATAAPT